MKKLLVSLLLASTIVSISTSCTKESDAPQPSAGPVYDSASPSVSAMQAWYSGASARGMATKRQLSINWNAPDTIANGAEPLAYVPIEATRVEFTSQYQGYRRLVAAHTLGNQLQGVIIEVLNKGRPLSAGRVKQVFREVYNAQARRQSLRLPGFNGFVAVYTRENFYITGRSFTNGVASIRPDWLEFLPGQKAAGRGTSVDITCVRSVTHYTLSGEDIITWTCSVTSGTGGTGTGSTGTGSTGTGSTGTGSTGIPGSGGGPGTGSSGPYPANPYDDGSGWGGDTPTQTTRICNNLPPCLGQSYASMLGAIALYASRAAANGTPSSFMPVSYFTATSRNWQLQAGPLPPNTFGSTHIDYANNKMVTVLDDQKLQNATDLRVIGLLLHESVHAYLVLYYENDPSKFRLDYPALVEAMEQQSQSQQNNTQHALTVTDFKNEIGQIMYTYCTQLGYNVSLQYCQDLAWTGLGSTPAFIALSQREKTRIVNAINAETSGVNALGLQPSGC